MRVERESGADRKVVNEPDGNVWRAEREEIAAASDLQSPAETFQRGRGVFSAHRRNIGAGEEPKLF